MEELLNQEEEYIRDLQLVQSLKEKLIEGKDTATLSKEKALLIFCNSEDFLKAGTKFLSSLRKSEGVDAETIIPKAFYWMFSSKNIAKSYEIYAKNLVKAQYSLDELEGNRNDLNSIILKHTNGVPLWNLITRPIQHLFWYESFIRGLGSALNEQGSQNVLKLLEGIHTKIEADVEYAISQELASLKLDGKEQKVLWIFHRLKVSFDLSEEDLDIFLFPDRICLSKGDRVEHILMLDDPFECAWTDLDILSVKSSEREFKLLCPSEHIALRIYQLIQLCRKGYTFNILDRIKQDSHRDVAFPPLVPILNELSEVARTLIPIIDEFQSMGCSSEQRQNVLKMLKSLYYLHYAFHWNLSFVTSADQMLVKVFEFCSSADRIYPRCIKLIKYLIEQDRFAPDPFETTLEEQMGGVSNLNFLLLIPKQILESINSLLTTTDSSSKLKSISVDIICQILQKLDEDVSIDKPELVSVSDLPANECPICALFFDEFTESIKCMKCSIVVCKRCDSKLSSVDGSMFGLKEKECIHALAATLVIRKVDKAQIDILNDILSVQAMSGELEEQLDALEDEIMTISIPRSPKSSSVKPTIPSLVEPSVKAVHKSDNAEKVNDTKTKPQKLPSTVPIRVSRVLSDRDFEIVNNDKDVLEIVEELRLQEESFLNEMTILLEQFRKPLEFASQLLEDPPLKKEHLESIFSMASKVHSIHMKLYSDLQKSKRHEVPNHLIEFFSHFARIYAVYLSHLPEALQLLEVLMENSSHLKLQNFIHSTEHDIDLSMTLVELLESPKRRSKSLSHILEKLKRSYELVGMSREMTDAIKAFNSAQESIQHMSKIQWEEHGKVDDIEKRFGGKEYFKAPGRQFIRMGMLQKVTRKTKAKSFLFVLFSDLLLYSEHDKIISKLPIDSSFDVRKVDASSLEKETFNSEVCFEVCSRQESFYVVAQTPSECSKWYSLMQQCIQYADVLNSDQVVSASPLKDITSSNCHVCMQDLGSAFRRKFHCSLCAHSVCSSCFERRQGGKVCFLCKHSEFVKNPFLKFFGSKPGHCSCGLVLDRETAGERTDKDHDKTKCKMCTAMGVRDSRKESLISAPSASIEEDEIVQLHLDYEKALHFVYEVYVQPLLYIADVDPIIGVNDVTKVFLNVYDLLQISKTYRENMSKGSFEALISMLNHSAFHDAHVFYLSNRSISSLCLEELSVSNAKFQSFIKVSENNSKAHGMDIHRLLEIPVHYVYMLKEKISEMKGIAQEAHFTLINEASVKVGTLFSEMNDAIRKQKENEMMAKNFHRQFLKGNELMFPGRFYVMEGGLQLQPSDGAETVSSEKCVAVLFNDALFIVDSEKKIVAAQVPVDAEVSVREDEATNDLEIVHSTVSLHVKAENASIKFQWITAIRQFAESVRIVLNYTHINRINSMLLQVIMVWQVLAVEIHVGSVKSLLVENE